MCILNELESRLSSFPSSEFCWNGSPVTECSSEECPERKFILCHFAALVVQNMGPAIDEKTSEPLEMKFHSKEAKRFSELFRIIANENLARNEKVNLITMPTQSKVYSFIKQLTRITEAPSELIIYQILLLERLQLRTKWTFRADTWRILIITSLRIVQKIFGLRCISSELLLNVYPIFQRHEFVQLESVFLNLLDYKISVTNEEYLLQLRSSTVFS
mmetsp:Transcript_39444/g.44905  ORF Transcript_39444/g.44905 Transcript_39444/m.44905 type:complete len:217 (-) Transcript_39444:135-785(-)